MWPHRRQPTRLPRPWDSPGKNTGVGCHFLVHCTKVKSESEVTQLCPTLSNPMDCSPPGCSIHGIFQARVLELGAIAFSSNSQSPPLFLPDKVVWTSWGAFPGPLEALLPGRVESFQGLSWVPPLPLGPERATSCSLKYFWRLAALPPWMRSETLHSPLQPTITWSSRPWASLYTTPTWNTGGNMKEIYVGLRYTWLKVSPTRQGELCTGPYSYSQKVSTSDDSDPVLHFCLRQTISLFFFHLPSPSSFPFLYHTQVYSC